jgi:heme/copper-type cytochrome/quinol oxidase subunit 2
MSIFRDSLASSLFIIWFVFIALIFIIAHFSERENGGK